MASQPLTEYERRRLENIKRNDEMMASLKLHTKSLELSLSTHKHQRVEGGKTYRTPQEKKPKSETPIVIRRSLRTRGIQPDSSTAKGLEDDLVPSPIKSLTLPKFSPENLESFTMEDAYSGSTSGKNLIDTINEMADNAPLWGKVKMEMRSLDLGSMDLKEDNTARVMPGKIMNVKFFPCVDRILVVAGNKYGDVAFWDVDCEEREDHGIYLYRPHPAPISGFVIQPFYLSKVYSSCYDGFIRLMDVEKESFDLVYSSDDTIFSLAQQAHDANSLYFGKGRGLLNIWDVRVGKSSSLRKLHDLRINTIDFNPENTNLMVTSSTDGTARLWDLRRNGINELKMVDHGRAVHSAYFSPSGSYIATTSIGDKVGIVSGVDFTDTSMVYHYNQTGRWLASFRAIWGWDDSHIFIGNMGRGVDVISTSDRSTETLQSPNMTTIPCRFAAHPYQVGTLAGATSGGQIYVWNSS